MHQTKLPFASYDSGDSSVKIKRSKSDVILSSLLPLPLTASGNDLHKNYGSLRVSVTADVL